ncbi:MAG TPA: hypothetical protein PLH80_08760 [Spirochaetota bacterium]|nr:hypothetical protein [Spirochaetota bacterium]HQI38637.1 hypothetical protein [Spirochaetota bacterium]
MSNVKKAYLSILIYTIISIILSSIVYLRGGISYGKGFAIGCLLSLILTLLWIAGAIKGMKSNTLVLLSITAGGFLLRLTLLAVFAAGGVYIFMMDLPAFAIAFLIGTIYSLILEVWFFTTLSGPQNPKFR